MRILDTLSGQQKELRPGKRIKIYLCGVTVYDDSHIGHARTIIVFDVLRRHLESMGHTVVLVQNFTDVDDKIIRRARDEKKTALQISEMYIARYHTDFDMLNVRRATSYPCATGHVPEMISLIADLVDKGAAYVSTNGVYFSVASFPEYGQLSKKKTDELKAGARVEVDEDKRDPLDFALWKFTGDGPAWDSPWGRGRPGWHIECSAMSLKYLEGDLDIHGGGRDLIFPHHENEIAQSESCTGRPLARIWMHVGMVTISGEKMSKSVGNVRSVRRVLGDWGPNVTRLFCLSGHYSKPVDYSEDLLRESLVRWRQLETAYCELVGAHTAGVSGKAEPAGFGTVLDECTSGFADAMDNDLNTHEALSSLFRLVREINKLGASGQLGAEIAGAAAPVLERCLHVLGLEAPMMSSEEIGSILDMIAEREALRKEGRYRDADGIRDRMASMGVELTDHRHGTSWVKHEKIGSGPHR